METDHKQIYESPQACVIEVKTQGLICASGEPTNPYDL